MQFVLKHRVQCLQWYITLVVSFASYPCNEHKTHVGRPKCESDTTPQPRSDGIFKLTGVMQLCIKCIIIKIHKLHCRKSKSSICRWPKNFMVIGVAILSQ